MTDYEFTDELTITLILWDHDRRDTVYVTLRPVFIDHEPTLQTYDIAYDRDQPGMEVTELPFAPETIDRLIASLRAHTYAERRAEVRPRPRDHQERLGRQPGPCVECRATGWIVVPIKAHNPATNEWRPCPRCLDHDARAS
jgi:hypothetical protein